MEFLDKLEHIDPAWLEEAERASSPKRRRLSPLRTGLIAACLCAVLVGTAFAGSEIYSYLTIHFRTEGVHRFYYVDTSLTAYPESAFSSELQQAGENWENMFEDWDFTEWEDVQEFLGVDCISPGGENWNGMYSVQMLPDHPWEGGRMAELIVMSHNYSYTETSQRLEASFVMHIYTENYRGELDGEVYGLGLLSTDTVEQLESYQMANGAVAEIVMSMSEEHATSHGSMMRQCDLYGHFVRRGILYSVHVCGNDREQEELLTKLQGVLDSFP